MARDLASRTSIKTLRHGPKANAGDPRRQRRDRRRRVHRHRRAVGLRQVDAAAHGGGPRGRSPPARSRSATAWSTTLEPKDRDIAMVFQNYALYPHMTRVRQHGLRPARSAGCPKAEIKTRVDKRGRDPRARPAARPQAARSSPAASASAWRWAARSCASRRCSCSTSRCPTSTPSCACRCASRSRSCTGELRHDQPLRHARPGRGDDARAAHDRDERRPRWSRSARRWRCITQPGHHLRRGLHRLAADEPLRGARYGRRARIRGEP